MYYGHSVTVKQNIAANVDCLTSLKSTQLYSTELYSLLKILYSVWRIWSVFGGKLREQEFLLHYSLRRAKLVKHAGSC